MLHTIKARFGSLQQFRQTDHLSRGEECLLSHYEVCQYLLDTISESRDYLMQLLEPEK